MEEISAMLQSGFESRMEKEYMRLCEENRRIGEEMEELRGRVCEERKRLKTEGETTVGWAENEMIVDMDDLRVMNHYL